MGAFMKLLEDKILSEGKVLGDDVLKVDMFLNHQLDPFLLNEMGKELKRLFENEKITKILTVEVSGIAIAVMAALHMNVPVVFAKKNASTNCSPDVYAADVYSFTKNKTYNIRVAKEYLNESDNVLIVDDFLANGNAVLGLLEIANQSGAKVSGVGIAVEKGYMNGRKVIEEKNVRLESLAIVEKMDENGIVFCRK